MASCPSWMSIARRAFPSRLELKRRAGSFRDAPVGKVSLRILLRVSPRQSPSSTILFELSSDADWPWLAPDFFMFSS